MWPGGRDDVQLEVADRDDVALAEALRAQPVRRVQRAHAAADPLGELAGRLGVVGVVVGEQHRGHRPGGRLDRGQVRLDRRAGVDHDRAVAVGGAEHPGVGAVEGHHVGVGRQHALGDLAEPPPGPAHRAGAAR